MNSLSKPTRRGLVKWGLGAAGLPLISSVLAATAQGSAKPEHANRRVGQTLALASGVSVYYKEEWLGAPWLDSDPVVFLHGNLETNEIWYGWVPQMAQHYRLFRPDLPGFGGSTAPANFEFTLSGFAKFVADFLDALGIQSAHIVGAKTGGGIAMQFAATYPQRTRSVVVASGPFVALGPKVEQNSQQMRLGTAATAEEMAYFDKMRDDMRPETKKQMEILLGMLNVDDTLGRITSPTLIITSDQSALQTVDTVLRYKSKIANSRLLVLSSDAYHVAVANADECVANVLTFYRQSVKR
ncbi:MAG TPA: alpha/beta hydrolase [Candidatus Acidoferrales bacterium]|jgi:pimeloyl-ACP methyl ester carboxylesterase|nr:alpha/beta hydrolase [Candidatus Acidoferrales bacterium]